MNRLLRPILIGLVVALFLGGALLVHRANQVRQLVLAAGPADGEGFAIAHAIADVIVRHEPRIEIVVLETAGSRDNMQLIEEGRVDLATVQANVPASPAARLIAALYPDAFQLIAREETGIESGAALAGRRIALPPRGGGPYDSFWLLAEHYGLAASDLEALPMTVEAAQLAMLTGAVDAVFTVRAPGNPTIRTLVESTPSRFVPIDQAAAMRLRQPALGPGTIPRGSYRGYPPVPSVDLATAAVQSLLVADAGLDDRLARTITETLFERRRDLVSITPLAGFISPADATGGTFLPLHPGARRYYDREKPSILQENAEILALSVSLLLLLGSGLLRLASTRRRGRLDRYNHQLLSLYRDARAMDDAGQLVEQRDRMMVVLGRVVDDAEQGRITSEGFHIFSFTWEAVNRAIQDRLAARGSAEKHEDRGME